ncbi:MAG: CHAD domain-containing protein [Thermoleophilia bacterium]
MPDTADPSTIEPGSRTLIAAATTATTAAEDPPPAPPPPTRGDDRFGLHRDETVADGLRRAARGRLAASSAALAAASDSAGIGEAVHGARKSIKRVRAVLRLSRDALAAQTYEHENATMRAIAGRLAGARDAQVLIETLQALEQRCDGELRPDMTERLRARLEDDHGRELAAMSDDGDLAVTTRQALEDARARTAQWSLQRDDLEAVEPGLRRVYGRGRKRLRAARDEPTAENLHAARKRVKDLWHAAELLREAHPKRMKRLARDAHELSSLLGDHHDLSVLRDYAEANPQLFSDMPSRQALLGAVDRRRDALRDEALDLGRRLFRRSPKRFTKDVARGWEKHVAASG